MGTVGEGKMLMNISLVLLVKKNRQIGSQLIIES